MQSATLISRPKILLAATGSVATIKITELTQLLLQKAEVRVILSESAKMFVNPEDISKLGVEVFLDEDERNFWKKRGDPVLHIELRKWADAMVFAPLSANTLAKIANGLSDTLVTLVPRSWDMQLRKGRGEGQQSQMKIPSEAKLLKPLIICPSMNTMMWVHPVTAEHLSKLRSWGFTIIDPIEKTLMCGDTGKGAMDSIETIVKVLFEELSGSSTIQND